MDMRTENMYGALGISRRSVSVRVSIQTCCDDTHRDARKNREEGSEIGNRDQLQCFTQAHEELEVVVNRQSVVSSHCKIPMPLMDEYKSASWSRKWVDSIAHIDRNKRARVRHARCSSTQPRVNSEGCIAHPLCKYTVRSISILKRLQSATGTWTRGSRRRHYREAEGVLRRTQS
eukprot:scaffold152751_cov39-Tisochrysis_lutea.AAC.2